jgi:hypothetical protein
MGNVIARGRLLVHAQEPTPVLTAYLRSDPGIQRTTAAIAEQVAARIFAVIGVPAIRKTTRPAVLL